MMGKRNNKNKNPRKQGKQESKALAFNPFAALAPNLPDSSDKEDTPSHADPLPSAQEADHAFSFASKVVVSREKKGRAGKTVTRISGIDSASLEPLKKQIKKALGCGATIESEDLVLLGSLVDRAGNYLESIGAPRVVKAN